MANNMNKQTIAPEVMNIVNAFASKIFQQSAIYDGYKTLAVSLYAIQKDSNVNSAVIDILKDEIVDLRKYLSGEEISTLSSNYQQVVEYCLDDYAKDIANIRNGQFSQPKELTTFILKALDIPSGSNVYLPFAGLCSEVPMLKECNIDGDELDPMIWAYGQVLLLSYKGSVKIECSDSFRTLEKTDKMYDYIISVPPFNIGRGTRKLTEYEAVRMAFENKLRPGGYLCFVLPQSLVFGSYKQELLREFLVDNGYLRAIISLPQIFTPFTGIKTVVLVAQKEHGENFVLVDGSSFVTKNTQVSRRSVFKYSSLLETMRNFDETYCKVLTKQDLDEGYNLDPVRHLFVLPDIKEGEKLYKVKKLVETCSKSLGRSRYGNGDVTFVMKKLHDSYIQCEVEESPVSEKMPRQRYEVQTPCVVVQVIFGKIKVGMIRNRHETCVIGTLQDAFFLRVDNSIVSDEYFLKALTSEFVAKQVEAKSIGSSIPRLTSDDFFSLEIPIPSLEAQKNAIMDDLNEGISEGEKKLAMELEEYKEDVHIKKHAVGQILFGLNSNWSLLNTIREVTGGKFSEDMVFGEDDDAMSVKEILDAMGDFLKSVNKAINAFTAGEEAIYKEEDVALAPFFMEYAKTHKNPVYTIEYQQSIDDFADRDIYHADADSQNTNGAEQIAIKKGDPTKWIKFSSNALERIMDDICANAVEYGFKGREHERNLIKVEIKREDGNYIAIISNNGSPANADMNSKSVFKFGVTSSGHRNNHSGIGGYEIKKLMERFGGKAEFVNMPKETFPVAYRLTFTKTNFMDVVNSVDDDLFALDVDDYIEEQKTLDVMSQMEIEGYIEEQKTLDVMSQMEIDDYIAEQESLDALEMSDEEIEWNSKKFLELLNKKRTTPQNEK